MAARDPADAQPQPRSQPHAAQRDRRWQEWVIAVGVVALSLLGAWTVFGDDLVQLFLPLAGSSSVAAPQNPVNPVRTR